MPNIERETAQAMTLARRAYLYRLFHIAFGTCPTAQVAARLCNADSLEALGYAADAVCCDVFEGLPQQEVFPAGPAVSECFSVAASALEGCGRSLGDAPCEPTTVESLQASYRKLFETPGDSYVHLWESSYVGKEGVVFQDSTLDVREFYHQAGFRLQAEKKFPDDHIAAMMDYLANLSQQAYEAFAEGEDERVASILARQRQFAAKHVLNWVGKFAQKVAENDELGFYCALANAMAAFVMLDDVMMEQLGRELVD